MNSEEALATIRKRLEGYIPAIESAGVPQALSDHLIYRSEIYNYTVQADNDAQHCVWVPLLHGCNHAKSSDFIHWIALYRHLGEALNVEPSLFHCYELEMNKDGDEFTVAVNSVLDALDEDGRLIEPYYAAALLGAEEDWWDYDLLGVLPERMESVQNTLQLDSIFAQMMGLEDGEPEAWLA